MEIPGCLYLFYLLVASVFMAAVSAVDPFSESLLSFKSELLDDSNSLTDWFVPSGEYPSDKIYACSWSGVTCNKNSTMVIGLDLSMKNLGGAMSGKQFNLFNDLVDLNLSYNSFSEKLPVGVFNLTNLRSLDISRNNFSGEFPSGISNLHHLVVLDAFSNGFSGHLPAEVSQLQSLKVLNFAGSYFSGPIPSEYGSFKSLEFIHLAGNFLSGDIPPELGNLKTVTHMEIGYNTYQGSIPWQLGNMSELQYLDIAGANLSGSIPRQLSNLTKLQSLFLFKNQLTGLIPWEFSKITPLTSLDLSDNQISGLIPESFAELKNLSLLSLMYNSMSGSVPQGIAQLPSLDTLLLWNNFFTGSLPWSLGRNSKLKYVDVSTNNFIGAIPPDICRGGMLLKLILFSNNFTGGLSHSLSNCSSLVRLRLEDNSFSGEIPLKFSNLPDITYVDLSRNRFTGGIPMDISQASNLQYFNVSNNPELGGNIPAKTWSLPLLQNFSASSCNISGNLPPFQFCELISVIELNMNNLFGTVPESVSNCHALERIDLADNNLIGHIPKELASLPNLSVLDLSHNNFSGSIPVNFGNSSSLVLLNVSFNDISGSIPSEKVFGMMGSSAFVGNPKLCGSPLKHCPDTKEFRNEFELGSRRTQKLAWVLIICAVVVLFVTVSVFGILYFRRGSKGQWKMVSFIGLPQFTTNDVLRSLNSIESMETVPPLSGSVCKAVLPTGITVSVKRIEWNAKKIKVMSEFINRMGNARHKNLIRLLGFCYNKHLFCLLYDYLPNGNLTEKIRMKRDWAAKYKIVIGVARGLCFLHHDCYPAIPHGDLKASNVVFDENMEPCLAEFGVKFLEQWNESSFLAKTGEFNTAIKEELDMDIYNFGEVILEILTNGRLTNAGGSIHSKPRKVLLREICNENEVGSSNSFQEEIKLVLEVALLCTRSRPSDRPSMEEALKLLTGLKPQRK
uniref:non-specific serine/threonine protein kinase n=1 Tax=Davidia involucrata TaxID=16924 RepID=A0A5B7AV06_DAVIN